MRIILCFFLCVFSISVYAGKDPVTFSLDSSFQNPIFTGRSNTITYTFTSQLPATMVKPFLIEKVATPASDFSYVDNCSGVKLRPHQSCTVAVTLTADAAGTKTVQLIMAGYDKNRVPVPAQTTTVQGNTISSFNVYGVVTQSLPSTSTIGTAQNYSFSFTNRSTVVVTNVSVSVSQTNGTSTFTTTCGSSLAVGGTCTVSGTYTPSTSSPNVQSVNAILSYDQSKSASIGTSTNVSSATGVIASFVGNNYLPAEMVGGGSGLTLWFLFTNAGPGTVTVTTSPTPVTATVGGSIVTLTPVFNHCNNVVLTVGAACDIQYTFQAATVVTPTAVTVQGLVGYTGGNTSSISTSTTVVTTMGTSRTVKFINNCSFDVWFSLNGSALSGSPACSTDSDCPGGSSAASCSPLTNTCFWKNYTPDAPGTFHLTSGGGTSTVTIPLTSADPTVQWSGNFSASLNCSGSSCAQADCNNSGGTTSCEPGKGFSQPATQAEITMNIATSDSYDVEVINGFHIPISMVPGPYVTTDNYNCGSPGAFTAGNGFGSCNWQTATPPGNGYYWVTGGGSACNISSPSCTASTQICGLDSSMNQVCGNFLGYWTADQVCSLSNLPTAVSNYFSCKTPLSSLSSSVTFPANSTLYNLMACPVPKGDVQPTFNSCYLTYSNVPANNQLPCCGCIDWWTITGINSNANTQSCTQAGQATPQTDPVWNTYLQSGLAWLKKACPSVYVYPFDDKTSGFSCTNTLPNQPNSVGYTITFCDGNSGLPAGKTDGR